ncbi:Major outer membrane protein P.IB [Frankliniella fusca]|uniref:Major outer membrane protein P.IB n=1 Tax=Frankliniella fusca TaxID=407009 RepID=A0AAE1LIL8_9NEOP|nr:Major outer membrane protein P.IB [Frankliniella fusca]
MVLVRKIILSNVNVQINTAHGFKSKVSTHKHNEQFPVSNYGKLQSFDTNESSDLKEEWKAGGESFEPICPPNMFAVGLKKPKPKEDELGMESSVWKNTSVE